MAIDENVMGALGSDRRRDRDDPLADRKVELPEPVREACEAVGRLMEYWGFSRHMGRFWTLLYLSPEPLSASEIQEALHISAGTASTIARQLLHWGVIHDERKPGDRKAYYRAETDLWKMGTRVLVERELNRIKEAHSTFDDAAADMKATTKKAKGDAKKVAAFQAERIDTLAQLCMMAEGLVQMFLESRMVDLGPIPDDLAQ